MAAHAWPAARLLELPLDTSRGLDDQAAVLAEGVAVVKPADGGPLHLEGQHIPVLLAPAVVERRRRSEGRLPPNLPQALPVPLCVNGSCLGSRVCQSEQE